MLEQAGLGKATYDAAGNLTGIVITQSLSDVIPLSDSVTFTVTKTEPPQYDRQHEQPLPDEKGNPHA
jgi:hypothetical protein